MTQNLSVTVASNIRAEVARRRINQTDLADLLGLSQAAVSRRLAGITPMRLDEIAVIADLLDCPVSHLVTDAA